MKTELFYLACVAILTGLLWVPYILDRVAVWGRSPGSGLAYRRSVSTLRGTHSRYDLR